MHTFHIPVMGIGFTIDTPVRVAHLGVPSVISLIDDILMEKMREFYCRKIDIPFQSISDKVKDFRAKRITAYLNIVGDIARAKFEELKRSAKGPGKEFERYFEFLPENSPLKHRYDKFRNDPPNRKKHLQWLLRNMRAGDIDVNIMTKLDKPNHTHGGLMPVAFNDAHAALRGFVNSNLSSSVVLSAGLNTRLFAYFEEFDDFYPDEKGLCRKGIILKVSDYRSASIQGKIFAKKGLWVSEYRIESGLNCGGHAFPTQGTLMGPILEEFKQRRSELVNDAFVLYTAALKNKQRFAPRKPPATRITYQGGVGTHQEHQFLLDHYQLDSVGWGSPFLLVPEVVNMDQHTLQLLCDATAKDLYLSDISPLGVPFNSLKTNTKDIEKQQWIDKGRPGSACLKKYGAINADGQCTASRAFQRSKIKALDELHLGPSEYMAAMEKITVKSCICVGLGTSALLVNNIDVKSEGSAVSVCPGPNLAYFNRQVSFDKMVSHIYGRVDLLKDVVRPHLFVNEVVLYYNYLQKALEKANPLLTVAEADYFRVFKANLLTGIDYCVSSTVCMGEPSGNLNAVLLQVYNDRIAALVIPEPVPVHHEE